MHWTVPFATSYWYQSWECHLIAEGLWTRCALGAQGSNLQRHQQGEVDCSGYFCPVGGQSLTWFCVLFVVPYMNDEQDHPLTHLHDWSMTGFGSTCLAVIQWLLVWLLSDITINLSADALATTFFSIVTAYAVYNPLPNDSDDNSIPQWCVQGKGTLVGCKVMGNRKSCLH